MTPGWFGKLPGMGDFAHRRLPASFREGWDHWLQTGLARMRDRHADWTTSYLEAPIWCFVLGPQVVDAQVWIGVLMPSVDGVGRYFPFAIAAPLEGAPGGLDASARIAARQWWARAVAAALHGLEGDLDALRFDALLARTFDAPPASFEHDDVAPPALALPGFGDSSWMTDPAQAGGARMTCMGLPRGEQFDALFGIGGATLTTTLEDSA